MYLLTLWIVLPEIFDHETAAALDDILDHLLRAACADPRELLLNPFLVACMQILRLHQRILPLALDPRPDRLNGIEV